jgi:hypothetical protein
MIEAGNLQLTLSTGPEPDQRFRHAVLGNPER